MAKRKKNYLNNKDMLKEIHLSKISYCSFADKVEDNQQDFIVESLAEIWGTQKVEVKKATDTKQAVFKDIPVIELARQARATRLTKLDIPTNVEDVSDRDIVFRVMTNEHIPRVPKKKSKAVMAKEAKQAKAAAIFDELVDPDEIAEAMSVADPNVELIPMRVSFPPFFHYRLIGEVGAAELVGKSHWVGDLETGHFSKDHGRTTGNLAMMYIKLCERYGTRSNWRGYTYNDEMQGQALLQLSQIGLQFNELKSQNPFAYYTAAVTNSFTRVLNIEKKMQNIRDDILESNGMTPSWTRQFANDKANEQFKYDYNYGKPVKKTDD